jgi:D-alanyl-D-alanine carboxypeptidase (penicillin-binding protein 5/6)
VLVGALLLGGQSGGIDLLDGSTTGLVAQADGNQPTVIDSTEQSITVLPSGEPTEQTPSLQPAAFLTDDLAKVQAKRTLVVYRTVDFSQDTATTRLVRKGSRVTVTAVAKASDGTPRLAIKGGFISAAKTDVARPTIFRPRAQAVYVFNVVTGKVLYSRAATTNRSIASLAKLMTALILREEIAAGRATWGQRVKVTSQALVNMSRDWSTGGTPLKRGKVYTLRQLDTLALVESNNAAVTQIGLTLGGSNAGYIKMMNAKARELGMKTAKFISISGLDNFSLSQFGLKLSGKAKDGNRVSAADLGKLTSALLTKYPDVTKVTSQTMVKVKKYKVKNTNQLLRGGPYYDSTLGVDGLKTGYTNSAGYCLVSTSKLVGHDRIAVVLIHSKNSADRFGGTRRLLKSVYNAYALTSVEPAN